MTSINHQNTWHSKETEKDYGPCTPVNGPKYNRNVVVDKTFTLPCSNYILNYSNSILQGACREWKTD